MGRWGRGAVSLGPLFSRHDPRRRRSGRHGYRSGESECRLNTTLKRPRGGVPEERLSPNSTDFSYALQVRYLSVGHVSPRTLGSSRIYVYNNGVGIRVHRRSATKHGCSIESIVHAAGSPEVDIEEAEDPPKRLLLGFDPQGRLLEMVALVLEDGTYLVVHAMKCRRIYYPLLNKGGEIHE